VYGLRVFVPIYLGGTGCVPLNQVRPPLRVNRRSFVFAPGDVGVVGLADDSLSEDEEPAPDEARRR